MTDRSIYKGTSKTYLITYKVNGVVANITGFTFYFSVKKMESQPNSSALISKTITTHSDPTNGQTQIILSPTDTNIPTGVYIYDIIVLDTSNNRYRVDGGKFTILATVTGLVS
jgi:Tfp pilus assembly protein PilV